MSVPKRQASQLWAYKSLAYLSNWRNKAFQEYFTANVDIHMPKSPTRCTRSNRKKLDKWFWQIHIPINVQASIWMQNKTIGDRWKFFRADHGHMKDWYIICRHLMWEKKPKYGNRGWITFRGEASEVLHAEVRSHACKKPTKTLIKNWWCTVTNIKYFVGV